MTGTYSGNTYVDALGKCVEVSSSMSRAVAEALCCTRCQLWVGPVRLWLQSQQHPPALHRVVVSCGEW